MTRKSSVNFNNVRVASIGGLPLFFVEDIKATYFMTDDDCEAVLEKFGRLVSDEVRVWAVSFEGFQALVALACYGFGGDPKDLRRYRKLMAD